MRVKYDPAADAMMITLSDAAVFESEEIKPGVIIDYDANDKVVGIEVLHVQQNYPTALQLTQLDIPPTPRAT